MKRKKFIVERILKSNKQSRNSDFILFFECLRLEFKDIKVEQKENELVFRIPKRIFKMSVSPESYRRVRQKFNQNGEYLPTKKFSIRKEKTKRKNNENLLC